MSSIYIETPNTTTPVDQGIKAVKEYSISSKYPDWKPHHQMQFIIIKNIAVLRFLYEQ